MASKGPYSGALAERSTVGKKIWLSMHPRNFGSDRIVRAYVRTYVHPLLLAVTRREKNNIKAESFFDYILMFTLTLITEKDKKTKETNFVGRKT